MDDYGLDISKVCDIRHDRRALRILHSGAKGLDRLKVQDGDVGIRVLWACLDDRVGFEAVFFPRALGEAHVCAEVVFFVEGGGFGAGVED